MELDVSQKKKLSTLAKQHGVKLMTTFGSQVSGRTHAGSDFDIGVLLNQSPRDYQPLLSLQVALEKIFPDQKIDVRYLHDVSPYFLLNAVYKGRLLYGDNSEYTKLCAKAFKEYVDTKPLRRLQEILIAKKQTELLNAKI